MRLRDEPDVLDAVIGRNWITRIPNRHPELVAKSSSAFDKIELNPVGLLSNLLEDILLNMEEKGFVMASQIDARLCVDGEDEEWLASMRKLGNMTYYR